jgi:membrane-associated phospholipid phosphatase
MIWFFSREFRRFKIPLYAMLLMLCASTVYLRYHYSSDVLIGLLVGTLSIGLTYRWQDGFLARRESAADKPEAEIEDTIRAGIDA